MQPDNQLRADLLEHGDRHADETFKQRPIQLEELALASPRLRAAVARAFDAGVRFLADRVYGAGVKVDMSVEDRLAEIARLVEQIAADDPAVATVSWQNKAGDVHGYIRMLDCVRRYSETSQDQLIDAELRWMRDDLLQVLRSPITPSAHATDSEPVNA